MKKFLLKSILFLLLLGGLLAFSCFCLGSSDARDTMLGAQIEKINRARGIPGERILIVGGSGCGQGFVTSNLCAKLNRPVYNMGLHAGLGLIYQMKSVESMVRRGDVILLVPEYSNFNGVSCYGEMELLMMVLDILPEHKSIVRFEHWLRLLSFVPKYGADKLRRLFMPKGKVCAAESFDSYGDSRYPSDLSPEAHIPFPDDKKMVAKNFSSTVIPYIREFVAATEAKGGRVLIFPPAYQNSSYKRKVGYIKEISRLLKEHGMPFVASPERYVLADRFFRDTPYHLNLKGRELRTELMAEDLARIFTR